MDLKKIKQLVSLVESSNISSLSIEEDNLKLEIKRELTSAQPVMVHQAPVATIPVSAPVPVSSEPEPSVPTPPALDPNAKTITSPMVGTFYASPNPESPAFVSVGSPINAGDVVCIVEAMKLFNEIESEFSGTIKEVCVKNGDAVEFGQPLFILSN